MLSMKKTLFLACCLAPLLSYAEGLPDLGDVSQAAISPQQERQIGEQSMFEIRADRTYLDDAEIADYLNQLGNRLVANSSEPSQEFEFFALNDNSINAFALPGGFIGVNSGLILIAQSESELASVLGHEIAHVTQHHLARMVSGQKTDSVAAVAALAIAILAARNSPQAAQAALAGVQAGVLQRQLNFTRTHEQEADRIGLSTLQKSGFDTRAMPAFFERLHKATRLLDDNTPSYLRTHPVTSERIADVAGRAQQTPYHLVADSLAFQLVRAKLQAMQRTPQEAIHYFENALGAQKFGNPSAQRYGLVVALLRAHQNERAAQEFSTLEEQVWTHPMLATLAGELLTNDADRNTFYQRATQTFPQHRALLYRHAELLIEDKQFDAALKKINQSLITHPNDAHLFELQARCYSAQHRPQEAHQSLAASHAAHGNWAEAIEQLELAKQAGTDFYQLSAIESKLQRYKEIAAAHGRR